jgi:hypothetical protein
MLNRVLQPFREFGWIAGGLYVVHRALQAVSPRLAVQVYELMVQPIPDKSLLPGKLGKSLEIREIRRGAPEVERMPARPDIKERRFEQGAVCLGAYRKGELIGYLWLCFDRYDEDEVRCTYLLAPPGQAVFDFDLYIFPEHRLGRAFVGIWDGVNEYLRERSIRFTFSRMTRFNLPSRRAHAHLGSRRVAGAVFLQAWSLEVMFATIRPFLHVSIRSNNRAKLSLVSGVPLSSH